MSDLVCIVAACAEALALYATATAFAGVFIGAWVARSGYRTARQIAREREGR